MRKGSWRLRPVYPAFSVLASYLSLASWQFIMEMLRRPPDLFFVQDYATGRFDLLVLIAKLFRIPIVAYHSGSLPDGYLGKWAKRWTIPRVDRIIVTGTPEREMLANRYGVNRSRLRVINTPIDTSIFAPQDRNCASVSAGLDPARRRLLYVGRLDDRVKGVGRLISAFEELALQFPDVDLLIVGTGPDEQNCASLLRPRRAGFSSGNGCQITIALRRFITPQSAWSCRPEARGFRPS